MGWLDFIDTLLFLFLCWSTYKAHSRIIELQVEIEILRGREEIQSQIAENVIEDIMEEQERLDQALKTIARHKALR